MKSLNNQRVTVPGGFRYFCEETGLWIPPRDSMPCYTDFVFAVKQHYRANNLPIGLNWEEKIQDQLCATLDGDWCQEFGYPVRKPGFLGFDFSSVLQGTRTLASFWVKYGGQKVEHAEAERRAGICVACPMNEPPLGCNNCNMEKLREAVKSVVNGSPTIYDSKLHACKICSCGLQAKIHFPLKCLLDEMTQEQKDRLPSRCWLK